MQVFADVNAKGSLMKFNYESTCGLTSAQLEQAGQQLRPEIERISNACKTQYESVYASISLPSDACLREQVKSLARLKRELNPAILVVIGIGGSNLGTVAVLEALYGKFYNEEQPEAKVYFADTVDTDHIYDIIMLLEQEFEKGNAALITIISKSGTTLESVANAEVFIYLLKKYVPEAYERYIVAITDEGSKLWELAGQHRIDRLAIPKEVGGRYSVFSAVGLFPLAVLGIDIDELHDGAARMLQSCTSADIVANPAALSAVILAQNLKNGFTVHDTFLFSVDLESLGKWYRQLMGESIGKIRKSDGAHTGITPTVSIGSTDLHSVAQLYLGGPHDKFTTFVVVQQNKSNIAIPKDTFASQLVANLNNKPLSSLMQAILQGTQLAYTQEKLPFVEVLIPVKTAAHIAAFMQFKMLEMMYLGFLLDVNPFDQPHVELYKKQTRKMLS